MVKTDLSESILQLCILLWDVNHSLMLVRQRELRKYHIPVRQAHILSTLKILGSKATIAEVAKEAKRDVGVISKQAVCLEKDTLIKRIKNTPKSNIWTLELTENGLNMAELSRYSKPITAILSSLTKEERREMELILNKIDIKLKKYTHDNY